MTAPDRGYDSGPDNLAKTGGTVDAPGILHDPMHIRLGIIAEKHGFIPTIDGPMISNVPGGPMRLGIFLAMYP